MTEIEKKALALVNEVLAENGMNNTPHSRIPTAVNSLVLLRAIEQHEAFRREVSDAVEDIAKRREAQWLAAALDRFITPKPVDPLVEVVNEAWGWRNPHPDVTKNLRAAMKARGYEITKINEGAKDND